MGPKRSTRRGKKEYMWSRIVARTVARAVQIENDTRGVKQEGSGSSVSET